MCYNYIYNCSLKYNITCHWCQVCRLFVLNVQSLTFSHKIHIFFYIQVKSRIKEGIQVENKLPIFYFIIYIFTYIFVNK